jgi:hypothetical protein
MPQLIPTELEDGSIIYFQVEGTANFVSHDRDLLVGDKAQNAAKEKAIQSFHAMQSLVRGYTVNTLNAFRNLQQIPIKPATKETTSKAQSKYHNDETN